MNDETSTQNNNQNVCYFKIPYVHNLSDRVASAVSNDNIKIAFSNTNTIGKLFFTKQKTKTPIEKQSNVVYKIPCNDCLKCYVGQTGRYLGQRMSEHQRDVKKRNTINPTALVEHTREQNHSFNFDNCVILDRQRFLSKRLVSEMINIKKYNTVNFRRDTENLSNSYNNIILKLPT